MNSCFCSPAAKARRAGAPEQNVFHSQEKPAAVRMEYGSRKGFINVREGHEKQCPPPPALTGTRPPVSYLLRRSSGIRVGLCAKIGAPGVWFPGEGCVEQEADGNWAAGGRVAFQTTASGNRDSLSEGLGPTQREARTSLEDSRRQNYSQASRQMAGCACALKSGADFAALD
jgi:hypothetical protein